MSATDTTDTPTPSAPARELHRSRTDRQLTGVAGGLGEYFEISPWFFRLAFIVLTLVGGAGILLYIVAALVIPDEGRNESVVSEALRRRRDRPWMLAGLGLVGIALISLFAHADFWPNSGLAWTLLLLGALAIVLAQRGTSDEPAAPAVTDPDAPTAAVAAPAPRPRKPSLFLPGLGVLLAAAGVLALVDAAGADIRWDSALAVGAIATGVAVAAGALFQRRTGGLALVGIVLAASAIAISAIDVRLDGPVGERDYHPFQASELDREYDVAIGELTLDLSDVPLRAGETEIEANVGIGELRLIVPDDVPVDVEATASAGDVNVFGIQDDGIDASVDERFGGDDESRTIRIDAHVGLGAVIVERETS